MCLADPLQLLQSRTLGLWILISTQQTLTDSRTVWRFSAVIPIDQQNTCKVRKHSVRTSNNRTPLDAYVTPTDKERFYVSVALCPPSNETRCQMKPDDSSKLFATRKSKAITKMCRGRDAECGQPRKPGGLCVASCPCVVRIGTGCAYKRLEHNLLA
jgi:hypothetical protein